MKLLVVSQVYPYPLHDGGRVDVYNRLKTFQELGIQVWLIPFYNPALAVPDLNPLESLVEFIYPIPYLRRKLSKVLHWRPYFIASKENNDELERVEKKLQGISFDYVLAESHHTLQIANRFKEALHIPKLILRSHNNEPAFMKSVARSSPICSLQQIFFTIEALKYFAYEKTLMQTLTSKDVIWHISMDEMKRFLKKYADIEQVFVPAAVDLTQLIPYRKKVKKNVLFVGALFSPNNLQGLKWYLKKVHPKLIKCDPDYKLIVAGNTKGANLKEIHSLFDRLDAFELIDTPKDLTFLYEKALCFINPMQFGAGVKLKTIEAALKGIPIVTTPCGNEGTGFIDGEHVLVGRSNVEFYHCLVSLFEKESLRSSLVNQAHQHLNEHYNQRRAMLSKFRTHKLRCVAAK